MMGYRHDTHTEHGLSMSLVAGRSSLDAQRLTHLSIQEVFAPHCTAKKPLEEDGGVVYHLWLFVCSFVRSCVCLFVRLFVRAFVCLFVDKNSGIHSFVCLFVHSKISRDREVLGLGYEYGGEV